MCVIFAVYLFILYPQSPSYEIVNLYVIYFIDFVTIFLYEYL